MSTALKRLLLVCGLLLVFPAVACAAVPKVTTLPVISGTAKVGQTLTTTNGTWSGSPTSYTYQWQDCLKDSAGTYTLCSNIAGATAQTYVVQASDVGAKIRVVVTAHNASGSKAAASAKVGPVPATTTGFAGPLFAAQTINPGGPDDGVPTTAMEAQVSPDGILAIGSAWEEYNHDARLFDSANGQPEGPFTDTRNGPGGGGILGVAVDGAHVYYASGNGLVQRSSRTAWLDPTNRGWFDNGTNDGTVPLTVDAGGATLGQMVLCDSQLYVIDGNAIKIVPTSLSGVTGSFTSTGARALACDRQGDVWASTGTAMTRYTSTGSTAGSFNLPSGVYADGIAADPSSDSVWVADNGQDQNFKQYGYTGSQTGSRGVVGGYLADGGKVDSTHFAGPRAIAIDTAGEVWTVESGDPGVGSQAWTANGPSDLITKFAVDGTVQWRDFASGFGGQGQPTADYARYFDTHWEYTRSANGNYDQPYAFTADPFTNPSDARVGHTGSEDSLASYTFDADGHRYLGTEEESSPYTIYKQRAGSEVMDPVVVFDNNHAIVTNGVSVAAPGNFNGAETANDYYMDDSQNVWTVGSAGQIWEYVLQGYAADGTPQYDWNHVNVYNWPSQTSQSTRRIEVHGTSVYVSGYSASDPNPDNDFDGWKSMGRTLVKFSSLPTSTGWPAPAWTDAHLYSGTGTSQFPYTVSFAVNDTGQVGVAWSYDPATNETKLDIRNASDGTLSRTISPLVPGSQVGHDDNERSLTARGGWIISEDDWYTRNVLTCAVASCS